MHAAIDVGSVNCLPWYPRTYAPAINEPRNGSSPAPSMMRPQRGSRAISTIGENVHRMPSAEASRAATREARSTTSGSQVAASANGIGNVVRQPWITSTPNSSGIFSRERSIAIRCSSFVSFTPAAFRIEPSWPAAIISS
jgi:hypothetical protein